jgi:hypothetical protein
MALIDFSPMSPIALLAFAFAFGALLQGISKRRWISIPLPAIVAIVWLAGEAGLFNSARPDSTALSVFVGFLPVSLALYAGAAALGSVVASAVLKSRSP